MKSGFTLSVPSPCSEDWNSFTPTETGGFCGRCQKNVIDFTHATDDEIIAFISKKPKHACGRFKSSQLKTYTISAAENVTPGFMLLKAGVAGLLLLLISKPASAQVQMTKPLVETHQTTDVSKEQTHSPKIVVKGRVVSAEDNSALPGISVVQKGTANGTQTDENGMFEFTLEPRDPNILIFSFIGLVTEEVRLGRSVPSTINVKMSADVTGYLGELIITGSAQTDVPYTERKSPIKRLWKKVTSWF